MYVTTRVSIPGIPWTGDAVRYGTTLVPRADPRRDEGGGHQSLVISNLPSSATFLAPDDFTVYSTAVTLPAWLIPCTRA